LLHPEHYLKVFSSLVHVFRNAVDHGIEPPDERAWIEKDEAGQITLSFESMDEGYRLTIQDDGQGIDPESIRKKLAKTHPQLNAAAQSDQDVIQNIFLPGFSSKEAIGEFSGRGVGMDAVREEVVKLGGNVKVYSEAGSGTKFVLEFPKMIAEPVTARSA
jgi:two-component system, chemotaxis family, sensor kinase CheA